MVVTTPGTVVDSVSISGTLEIRASNVTVQRSKVRAGSYSVVKVSDGLTGVLIVDTEIDGTGSTENAGGVNGPATVRRANIYGVENGVVPGSGSLIEDSWIHNLSAPGAPHYDGIQIDGGLANIVMRHNSITVPDQTGAVMIDNYFGSISNMTVDNNLLSGGTYTLYVDGQFTGGSITGVRVTNNRFVPGQYGYASINNNTLAASYGNVNNATGQPVNI